jgi:hypothetical protein
MRAHNSIHGVQMMRLIVLALSLASAAAFVAPKSVSRSGVVVQETYV